MMKLLYVMTKPLHVIIDSKVKQLWLSILCHGEFAKHQVVLQGVNFRAYAREIPDS